MIEHISIRNFAIIENTEIDFEDGLNIITGETGAGKSIVIEAISLALGSRADSSFVRNGTDRAEIRLQASLDGEEIVIAREIAKNGRNLCRINGELASVAEVSRIASRLAAIHGQYDNQTLLDPDSHLPLLDSFLPEKIGPAKAAFDKAYESYKSVRSELDQLLKEMKEVRQKRDFYEFEKKEIDAADLTPGEEETLEDRVQVLQNSEKIYTALSRAEELLSGNEGAALDLIGDAEASLLEVSGYSRDLKKISEDFTDARCQLEDISARIRDSLSGTSFTPGELDSAISRLELISGLKKKYGADIETILARRDEIAAKLSGIETFTEDRDRLEKQAKEALAELKARAEDLSAVREETASVLSERIQKELSDLNFSEAKFSIDVHRATAISKSGADECEILISTNRGEPMKPLVKVASGGEISRIMLAIRNVTADTDEVPTMIFDEIDTGISGVTASVVARKLVEIAERRQVICITHLPQIAAAGGTNFRIYKESDEAGTYTHVRKLKGEEKKDEIARLLAGDRITETTRKSAGELIDSMKNA
ncbi:MAG: DNA repair protein RecN [Anaerovoracaceae bacterium]|jgi:DNA repair protein RecN (Recombination protein N)